MPIETPAKQPLFRPIALDPKKFPGDIATL